MAERPRRDEAMAQSPAYTVKSVEPVAIGSDVQARLFTLAPGEAIPWHFHSHVADWYFVLPGRSYHIPPRTAHLIANHSDDDVRFLLIQGVGAYDFRPVGG